MDENVGLTGRHTPVQQLDLMVVCSGELWIQRLNSDS